MGGILGWFGSALGQSLGVWWCFGAVGQHFGEDCRGLAAFWDGLVGFWGTLWWFRWHSGALHGSSAGGLGHCGGSGFGAVRVAFWVV